MPRYELRILLETVEGNKTSYYSSGSNFLPNGFIDTTEDGNFMSASMVRDRVNRMVSCSYQNETIFTGNVINGLEGSSNYFEKNTNIISASLSGSADTGSVQFTSLDTEYDRLLRYKFIGEKVTNTLGLPSDQWVYTDQVRLPADDEANIFQGNANLGNVNISDTLTFAGGSNVNSDVPILIDTGSDRYIKFVDERATSVVALRMGYDTDTDTYEISGSDDFNFNIGGINTIFGDVTASDEFLFKKNVDGGNHKITIFNSNSDGGTDKGAGIEFKHAQNAVPAIKPAGKIIAGKDGNYQTTGGPSAQSSNLQFFTARNGTDTERLRITSQGEARFTGNISASGDIIAEGDIIAQNYIVQSTVTQITTSFSSGSNIFGDTPADDTHQFTGSVFISGSGNDLIVGGNTGIGNLNPPKTLTVAGDISGSELFLRSDDNPLITLERNSSQNTAIVYKNTNGTMVAGIDNDAQNDGANVFGIGYVGDLVDSDGTDNATFIVTGSQVVINNATSASEGSALTVGGNISVGSIIDHIGDDDTKITFTDDDINITVGGVNMIDLTEGGTDEITFNEAGADLDFRVEGSGDANLLFTNAGTDKVGIGTNAPPKKLTVAGAISASQNIFIGSGTGTDERKIIHSGDEDTHLLFDNNKANLVAGGWSIIKFDKALSHNRISINNTNQDLDTQIMAENDKVIVHVDAGMNSVGINTTVPITGSTAGLTVEGGISSSGDLFKTKFVQMTNSSSVIDTFNTGSFRSAKYTLQVTSASNYQVSELLVLHHNSTASNTEYAQINSGLNLIDFTTDISNSDVRLNAAGSFISCSVRLDRIIIPT